MRSRFSSYGLANHDLLQVQIIALHSLLSHHFLKIISYNPILSLIEYFLKKKPWLGSHSTLGENERYFEDNDIINRKGKARNKSPTFKKGLKEKRDIN
jgi:hypothetical protein